MKKLLLITYHFPPDAEVGGVRPYQLAHHLPQLGFDTHVLTVEPAFAESQDLGYQPDGVPRDRVVRTSVEATLRDRVLRAWRVGTSVLDAGGARGGAGSVSGPAERIAGRPRGRLRSWVLEWLAVPDIRRGWYRPALHAGEALLASTRFDLIFSTSPPRTAHLVASKLASRHSIPWVMDLRDPWYDGRTAPMPLHAFQRSLFRQHAPKAALLVANTEAHRRFLQRIPGVKPNQTACVPNGVAPPAAPYTNGRRPPAFSIGYFGQMPGRRSARPFLEGLRRWLDRQSPAPAPVLVRFVGSGFDEARRVADSLRLDNIAFEPRVPRARLASLMADQFVLLVLAHDQPLQIPGKAYEYLTAARRILACTESDSATAELLSSASACSIAEVPEDVADTLERWNNEYTSGADAHVDRSDLLASMTHRRRAEQFANLFGEVVSRSAPG